MSIGNYVYKIYFFLCQYSVSLDWRLGVLKKSKSINRRERKGITQRSQRAEW